MPTKNPQRPQTELRRAARNPASDYRRVLETLRLWGAGTGTFVAALTDLDLPRVSRASCELLADGLIWRAGSLRGLDVPLGLGGKWLAPTPDQGGVPGPICELTWPRGRASGGRDYLRLHTGRGLSARVAYTLLISLWIIRAVIILTDEPSGCASAFDVRVSQGFYDPTVSPPPNHPHPRPYAVPDALVRFDVHSRVHVHVEIPYRDVIPYDSDLLGRRNQGRDAVLYVVADEGAAMRLRAQPMFGCMPRARVLVYRDEVGLQGFLSEHQERLRRT